VEITVRNSVFYVMFYSCFIYRFIIVIIYKNAKKTLINFSLFDIILKGKN